MKVLMLFAIMFYCINSSKARLTLRVTDKPKFDMTSNENVKDISNSKKDIDGPEMTHYYTGKVRTPRHGENTQSKNVTRNPNTIRPKIALVKKPIPKYKEIDSEEDYNLKSIKTKWPAKLNFDSIQHEDEDFNLNDYDFDVNHDEFNGRGKPLEPGAIEPKKTIRGLKTKSAHKTKRNPVIGKVSDVKEKKPNTIEIKQTRKLANKMEDKHYDNHFRTSITNVSKTSANVDDDSIDETESRSDYRFFIRNARSPWTIGSYVDKIGEKTTAFMTKILGFLPLFPQIPEQSKSSGVNLNH